MKHNDHGIKGFIHSFRCAVGGVLSSIVNERNVRIHIVAAAYVLYFSTFYDFTRGEYILLVMTVCLVLSTEMLNTAIEAAVDLVTEEYARLAKAAKDIAAGAVLVTAMFAVVVGVLLFWDTKTFGEIVAYFVGAPMRAVLLGLSVLCASLFILKIGGWAKKADQRYSFKNGGSNEQHKK